jgi:transposase
MPPVPSSIARKLPDRVGFAVLPGRWVVKLFFAWINRNRRLAEDFGRVGHYVPLYRSYYAFRRQAGSFKKSGVRL